MFHSQIRKYVDVCFDELYRYSNIIQIEIFKYHKMLYPTHVDKMKKSGFRKKIVLSVLHDGTSGAHCATPKSLSRECPSTSKSIYRIRIAGLVIVND